MTIKQQGGIFGRNPSFNSVTTGSAIFGDNDKAIFGNGSDLQIYHDGSNSYVSEASVGSLRLQGTNLQLQSSAGENYLQGINNDRVDIYYDGSIKLTTTATGVSVTGNVAVPSGNGIDFSATSGTGTSELFDDYEEGTWTPELRFGNATTGITYDIQAGNYVKVGRQVTVSCEIDLSSKGTATGIVTLLGYPYSIAGDGATAVIDTISGFASLVASGSTFLTVDGSTGRVMRQTATGREHLSDTNFTYASKFYFSMTYITV